MGDEMISKVVEYEFIDDKDRVGVDDYGWFVYVRHFGKCQICGNDIDKIDKYILPDRDIERGTKNIVGFCENFGDCDYSWRDRVVIRISNKPENPDALEGQIVWI